MLKAAVGILQSSRWILANTYIVFEQHLQAILAGEEDTAESENDIGGRVFKTRMVPNINRLKDDDESKPAVNGVWGLVIDVTDMKDRAKLELDNARLMAEEQAAQDSNRMKSQFLANVSQRSVST